MGTKYKKGNLELFDGYAVEHYNAAFTGKFDPDEIDSEKITYDDHVCFVVMGKAGEVRVKPNKDDELVRTNYFTVLRVVQITADLAEKTLQVHFQGTGTPQLPLLNTTVFDALQGTGDDPDEDEEEEPAPLSDEDAEWELPKPAPVVVKRTGDPALQEFLSKDPEEIE